MEAAAMSGSNCSEDGFSSGGAIPDWARQDCGEFFEQTWRAVLYRARCLVAHDEAEDLMHDAYTLALVRWTCVLHSLSPSQRMAWIKTAIARIAHDRHRRTKTYHRFVPVLYKPWSGYRPDPAEAAMAAITARAEGR